MKWLLALTLMINFAYADSHENNQGDETGSVRIVRELR